MTSSRESWNGVVAGLLAAALAASACTDGTTLLTQLLEARRLASELQLEFSKSAEAANRAVMAETDEGSAAAVEESRRSRKVVEQNVDALQAILQSQGYREDMRFLEGFKTCFEESRRIDDEILPLAAENTNVKAQRLSFGPAREASDAFRSALDKALRASEVRDSWHGEALAARAVSALLQIQVLQAPHIAEADDAVMTRIEGQMAESEAAARTAVQQLKTVLSAAAAPQLADAIAALDRFNGINKELIVLSRRNSEVRSLALTLGRKRTVTAECEDQLRGVQQALAKHEFTATR